MNKEEPTNPTAIISAISDDGPLLRIITGPNGSGKTTFARELLPRFAEIKRFINADLIAAGLSPFDPDAAAVTAGRLVLEEIQRLADQRLDFAFETTLPGLTYAPRIRLYRQQGYRVLL
jgi:predicted ABC-type ATPase